jgi:hypothetical protein
MDMTRIESYARYTKSRLYREDREYADSVTGSVFSDHGNVLVYADHYKRSGKMAVLLEMCYGGRMYQWSIAEGGTLSIPHLSRMASEFAAEVAKQAVTPPARGGRATR